MPYSKWTFRRGKGRNALIVTATIIAGGAIAAWAAFNALESHNRNERAERFDALSQHLAEDISARMAMFEHGLRGARGAVIASTHQRISRERFERYSQSREYAREFPGVLGFGYVFRVPRDEQSGFVEQMRGEGLADFDVREIQPNPGDRFVVAYYAPAPAGRGPAGLDLASEPARRAAAVTAAATGRPTMTAPLLLQREPEDGSPGFLVFLANYAEDVAMFTDAERERATVGWALAAIDTHSLFQHSVIHEHQLHISLADQASPDAPFYTSTSHAASGPSAAALVIDLPIYGRHWLLSTQPTPAFIASLNQVSPKLLAALVLATAVLLAALNYLFLVNQFRHRQILRKQAELASLVSHSSEAIIAEDHRGRITHWNPAAEQIFGHTAAQALDRNMRDLLAPQDYLPQQVAAFMPAAERTEPVKVQQMQHKDGSTVVYVLCSVAPIFGEHHQIIGHSHFLRDVSERVLAQQRVLQANATLEQQVADRTSELVRYSSLQRAILAHAGYAIVATDQEGVITLFNPAAERLLGYAAHDMIGHPNTHLFLDPDELERRAAAASAQHAIGVAPRLEAIAAETSLGRSDTREWTYINKGRRRFPVLLTLSTLLDDNDGVMGYLSVAVDLSEQKLREQQLRLAINAAESANQSKTDFLANMSHEIRTPMNAILGLLYLLHNSQLPPSAKDMLQKIDVSARSLLDVINDILDFSKIEAGRIELETEAFDLEQLLDNIAGLMSAALSTKPVEMIIEPLPPDCRWLKGDALRLNQVLINLVGNAIKFTEQGEVIVSIKRFPAHAPGQVKLLFSVRDTGIGISEEKRTTIFSPFQQADTSTSRRFGGSGLGLTISSRLVELMGGQLEVDSTLGNGSEFYFAVCLELSDMRGDLGSILAEQRKLRVLIADDHEQVLENLVSIATAMNWQVQAVTSGEAALAAVNAQRDEPFDIFLLDWRMPGIDGLSVAHSIRDNTQPGHYPIIVMVTAYERKLLEQQADHRYVDAVMTKPVTSSSLHRMISSLSGPVLQSGISGAPDTASNGVRRLAGVRLLLVDDSEINCEVAQRILQGEGASVEVAHDGQQAMERLKRDRTSVDLVLMDVQMPLMDGYEATRRLRQDPVLADLPVIALTAGAFRQQEQLALSAGMDGFIAKPFNVGELVAIIQRFLPQHGPGVLPRAAPKTEAADGWHSPDPDLLDGGKAQTMWTEHAPYQRYLGKLLHEQPDPAATIAKLLHDGHASEALAYAHKLKGSAGSLALPRLREAAGEVEQALDLGRSAVDALSQLDAAMTRTTSVIRDFLQRNAGHAAPDLSQAAETSAPLEAADGLSRLLEALESDDAGQIEHALSAAAVHLPEHLHRQLVELVADFEFRQAEHQVRSWQADTHQS